MASYPMVDLHGQYQKIKEEIDREIWDVIESTRFIGGPKVSSFAENLSRYIGCKSTIPCANGTDALQIALMALDLKEGDEIITTPFTFVATAEVIALLNLKPVFVDIEPDTYNIDPKAIQAAITSRTKCIIPVHLFGQVCDMEPILAIAKKHGIYVIEDNAQGIGASYRFSDGRVAKAGSMGEIGTTSFFPSKNLGCYGDGGAVNTSNPELAMKMAQIANHGSPKRYYHDFVGVNSRLDAIQAGILNVKLAHLDSYTAKRREAATRYNEMLSDVDGLVTPITRKNCGHVFHQYTLRATNGKRDEICEHLSRHGVSNAVYYPIPLHLQNAYAYCGYKKGDLPFSEAAAMEVFSIPIHTELTAEVQKEIVNILKDTV